MFQVDLFDKTDSFHFSLVQMPDKSIHYHLMQFYYANSAESCRIARASKKPDSFSTASKILITRMNRQWVYI